MPARKISLNNGYFYHIYNRGVEKRDIFTQKRDYQRFKKSLFYYQYFNSRVSFSRFAKSQIQFFNPLSANKRVEIICYCFMPNHFHLLVRQLMEHGITNFMSQFQNSYTKYFNFKYKRVGPLFQGEFKAILIESDEQLIHLSRYIHLNPVVSGIVKKNKGYYWSSYEEFINGLPGFCIKGEILNFFTLKDAYKEFVENQIDYGITLETLKHQLIND